MKKRKNLKVNNNHINLVDMMLDRTAISNDKVIYQFLDQKRIRKITYQDLDSQVRKIAALLQDKKLASQNVLLFFTDTKDFISSFFACLYTGVVAVPVFPPQTQRSEQWQRLYNIINDCRPRLALTTSSLKTHFIENLNKNAASIYTPEIVSIDDAGQFNANDWKQLNLTQNSLAFLQYTSGSTGDPKGVMVTHGNLLHNFKLMRDQMRITDQDRFISWLPFYHDLGLIGNILLAFYCGSDAVLMSPVEFIQQPYKWLEVLSQFNGTISGGPNFAYDLCAAKITEEQKSTLNLSHWRIACNTSEPINHMTLKNFYHAFRQCKFKEKSFYTCYGLAESTLFVVGSRLSEKPLTKILDADKSNLNKKIVACSGYKNSSLDLIIVDPRTKKPVASGEEGEIWIKGYSVAEGYYARPKLTKEVFKAFTFGDKEGPYLRTGDIGIYEDDHLFITGRLKEMMIIRGQNFYPADIEHNVVDKNSDIFIAHGSAVFSTEVDGSEKLIIVQELTRAAVREKKYREYVQTIHHSINNAFGITPYCILLVKPMAIKKTSSGKIRRLIMRQLYESNQIDALYIWKISNDEKTTLHTIRQVDSTTSKKTAIIEILAAYLNLAKEDIAFDIPFSQYGVDSLTAVQISGELSQYFQKPLPETLLYDCPDLARLIDYLDPIAVKSEKRIQSNHIGDEEVAIIGMACRFPGANNTQKYWQLLLNSQTAISSLPESRKNLHGEVGIEQAGFLDNVDLFDAMFFSIADREAHSMDPQQRLLLEVSYHALEQAGITLSQLSESNTGVFIGASNNEYAQLQSHLKKQKSLYFATGGAMSIASNRLSYFYNLHGPSYTVDTACSSSLSAVHLACQSLLNNESDLVIAGGVNLILAKPLSESLHNAGMLAKDYRCKTFDESADGYVRGEGCGVVILKKLSVALRDKDNILAIIKSSACNQDGRSNGITAPNVYAQETLLKRCLGKKGIDPLSIEYIETHGSATSLGDAIEITALKRSYQSDLDQHPCYLGAVKTNIGHLEAAAGCAGLIKLILVLQNKLIPANLNFNKINKNLELETSRFRILKEKYSWLKSESIGLRRGAISSFGFGGTNVHMVVEENTQVPKKLASLPLYLLPLAAKSLTSLVAKCQIYYDWLEKQDDNNLPDICYTAAIAQNHFSYRCIFVAKNKKTLCKKIKEYLENQININIKHPLRELASYKRIIDYDHSQKNWRVYIEELCAAYCLGKTIDWFDVYSEYNGHKIPLPAYPFQSKSYWYDKHQDFAKELRYQLIWKSSALLSRENYNVQHQQNTILCIGKNNDDSQKLTNILTNDKFIYLTLGDRLSMTPTHLQLTLQADSVENILEEFLSQQPHQITKIVCYLSDRMTAIHDANDQALIQNVYTLAKIITHVLARYQQSIYCCFIMTGDFKSAVMQSYLGMWQGLVKTFDLEFSQHKFKYLECDESTELANENLCLELLDTSERLVRYENGIRQISRLIENKSDEHYDAIIFSDKSYLITGGLGALGLQITHWLYNQGARHFILVSRSGKCEPNLQYLLNELLELDAELAIVKLDITQSEDVRRFANKFESSYKPLAAIIHAAGVLGELNRFQNISEQEFNKVCFPKVCGLLNLYSNFDFKKLDFIWLFSSIAATWGSSHLASYVAANSALDQCANYWQKQGIAVSSIAWGPWNFAGMAKDKQFLQQLAQLGIKSFTPEVALNTLNRVAFNSSLNHLIVDVDLQQFWRVYSTVGNASFLNDLVVSISNDANETSLIQMDRSTLTQIVVDLVNQILGSQICASDYSRGFFSLGFDSLMLVELNEKLQMHLSYKIPVDIMFNYGSVTELVDYLSASLQNKNEKQQSEVASQDRATVISNMSETEALNLLANQLLEDL